jgi:hypothetical protein
MAAGLRPKVMHAIVPPAGLDLSGGGRHIAPRWAAYSALQGANFKPPRMLHAAVHGTWAAALGPSLPGGGDDAAGDTLVTLPDGDDEDTPSQTAV